MINNKKYLSYTIVILLLFLLISIRFYEKILFDDGLITFFQHDYLTQTRPNISFIKIIRIDTLRFILNSAISISLLITFFKQKNLGKFLISFYLIALIINLIAFYIAWIYYSTSHYIALFYIRRILIQPIWLFILFPALLYQKSTTK